MILNNQWTARSAMKKAGLDADVLEMMFEGFSEGVEYENVFNVYHDIGEMMEGLGLSHLLDDNETWDAFSAWMDTIAPRFVKKST